MAFALGALVAGAVAGAVHRVALVVLAGSRASDLLNAALAPMLRTGAGRLLPGLALLELEGHRSGRRVQVVVGQVDTADGHVLVAADAAHKRWWRNFTSPHPAEVCVTGRHHEATGHAVTAGADLDAALAAHAARHPRAPVDRRHVADGTAAVVVLDHTRAGIDPRTSDPAAPRRHRP